MAPPLTPADLAALTKVQARVKGWALRNKMRLARLEEAAAAGGPHAVFSLSPKDCGRLRDVFPCGLRTVSACGTLYVFDKHLAYHSEAAPAGVFSPARDEVKMCVPLSCVAHVCAKEEYVSEPGVLVTLVFCDADAAAATTKTSATKVWWGGMHSPSLVVDALERALVDAKGGLRSSASVERARAARAMVRKAASATRRTDASSSDWRARSPDTSSRRDGRRRSAMRREAGCVTRWRRWMPARMRRGRETRDPPVAAMAETSAGSPRFARRWTRRARELVAKEARLAEREKEASALRDAAAASRNSEETAATETRHRLRAAQAALAAKSAELVDARAARRPPRGRRAGVARGVGVGGGALRARAGGVDEARRGGERARGGGD